MKSPMIASLVSSLRQLSFPPPIRPKPTNSKFFPFLTVTRPSHDSTNSDANHRYFTRLGKQIQMHGDSRRNVSRFRSRQHRDNRYIHAIISPDRFTRDVDRKARVATAIFLGGGFSLIHENKARSKGERVLLVPP